MMRNPRLLAVSDLHIRYPENQAVVDALAPGSSKDLAPNDFSSDDWLIVAGDVAETSTDIRNVLGALRDRFAKVIWAPGNHELWTAARDPVRLRGVERYQYLVETCRELDVLTPEDEYPVWHGEGGPAIVAPLFVSYDYSFRVPGVADKEESLAAARKAGVVCTDEYFLFPDPYPTRDAWCWERVRVSEERLNACDPDLPTILVNHYPLVREPTQVLRYPLFAQWCGTDLTADWHRRYRAIAMVYGHLHIPRTTWYDGVRFEEVSLGYPREWGRFGSPVGFPRQILPEPTDDERPVTNHNGFLIAQNSTR